MPRRNEPVTRMCIVTREVRPTEELIRFVLSPDGEVVPDLRHRLPGRGVWVTAKTDTVALAEKKKLFARGFEGPVKVEPGLAGRVEERLRTAAMGALSMARKAGELVLGNAKVEGALASGEVLALVHASDASDDGVRKLAALAGGISAVAVPAVRALSSEEMGLALGRPNVIHAALLAGRASQHFLDQIAVLARYSQSGPGDGAGFAGTSWTADQSAGLEG